MRRWFVVAVVVVGIALVMVWWWRVRAPRDTPAAALTAAPNVPNPAPTALAAPDNPQVSAPAGLPKISAETRARILRSLELARSQREKTGAATRTAANSQVGQTSTAEPGTLDKDYIRARIEEIKPLVRECYVNELAAYPTLQGKLVIEMVLAGEPAIGGVVETSVVDPTSTLRSPNLEQCVAESMHAIQFDPPVNGGRITVRYPFSFSTEPPAQH